MGKVVLSVILSENQKKNHCNFSLKNFESMIDVINYLQELINEKRMTNSEVNQALELNKIVQLKSGESLIIILSQIPIAPPPTPHLHIPI